LKSALPDDSFREHPGNWDIPRWVRVSDVAGFDHTHCLVAHMVSFAPAPGEPKRVYRIIRPVEGAVGRP